MNKGIKFYQCVKSDSVFHIIILSTILWLFIGCQTTPEEVGNTNRTYYESLELDTPELAVQTFVSAFDRADFVTVYMVLAPATQQELRSQGVALSIDNFIHERLVGENQELFIQKWTSRVSVNEAEQFQDTQYIFYVMMQEAAELGFIPFQFNEQFEILGSESTIIPDGQNAVDLMIMFEGDENPIIFRLIQSPDKRWRVFQVIWPGGDETDVPWALGPNTTSRRTVSMGENTNASYPNFDLSTPEKAVQIFCQMFREDNFPEMYRLFHPEAQRKWWFDFGLGKYQNLARTEESLIYRTDFGQRINNLKESGLIDSGGVLWISEDIRSIDDLYRSVYTPLVMEHIGDTSYLFDQTMSAARGAYLIDLSQPITIQEIREETLGDNETVAIVLVNVEGISEKITFRLKKSSSEEWRIWQVSIPGGDEKNYPWSAP